MQGGRRGNIGRSLGRQCRYQPKQHEHRGCFGSDRKKSRYGHRGRFVGVGCPDVERHPGQLEQQPRQGEQHGHGRHRGFLLRQANTKRVGSEIEGAGHAIEQRHAVEHHGRTNGPEQQVLDAAFRRLSIGVEGREQVRADRHQFDAQVNAQQVDRQGHQKQAQRHGHQQSVPLHGQAPGWASHRRIAIGQPVVGQHQGRTQRHHRLKKDSLLIDVEQVGKQKAAGGP